MTRLDVSFRYGAQPGEREMEALDDMREVYGVFGINFNEAQHLITVEYDASRLSDDDIAFMLRNAGLDLRVKVPLAA